MKNPKDGKIYFVDTEDDKNFMSEYEGRIAPIKTINFHLATTDIKVEVPLAHFTKTV